jgi:hypothetical protein
MKGSSRLLGCLAATLLAAGCASTQQRVELASALGQPPSEAAANQVILDVLARALKDPGSLQQYRIVSGPTPVNWYRGLLNGGGFDSAWMFCFEYNAKNSFGGYTGVKLDRVALRAGPNGEAYAVPVNWQIADAHC